MNCCSIVEAPWTAPLCSMSSTNARAMPRMSTPLLVVEALVLDRDHRLLDDLRDLAGGDDHAVLLAEHADRVAEVVVQRSSSARPCTARSGSARAGPRRPTRTCRTRTRPGRAAARRAGSRRSAGASGAAWRARLGVGWGMSGRSSDAHRRRAERDLQREDRTRSGGARRRRRGARRRGSDGTLAGRRESSIGLRCRTPPTRPTATDRPARLAAAAGRGRRRQPARRGRSRSKLREAARGGPPAAREARDRPDGAGHPPRPRGRAAQAARVPGRRPPGGADRRRLHRARGRSVGALDACARCSPTRRSTPTPRPSRSRR